MRRSPLEADCGHVEAVTRFLSLGEPSVGHAESTQPHPVRLLAEIRDLGVHLKIRAYGAASTMYALHVSCRDFRRATRTSVSSSWDQNADLVAMITRCGVLRRTVQTVADRGSVCCRRPYVVRSRFEHLTCLFASHTKSQREGKYTID